MSASWDPDGSTASPPLSQQDVALDRQMVRHLASRYTLDQIMCFYNEETKSLPSRVDRSSIASSFYTPSIMSEVNSVLSEDQPSIFDGAGSVRSLSDASSTASIISNVAATNARLLVRKSQGVIVPIPMPMSIPQGLQQHHNPHHHHPHQQQQQQQQQQDLSSISSPSSSPAPNWALTLPNSALAQLPISHQTSTTTSPTTDDAEAAAAAARPDLVHLPSFSSGTSTPKQKGVFSCGFCKEEGIIKTCTRKNDLKRHIEDFHNMDAQWFCRHRGCKLVFDWQAAYKTHLKAAHGGSRMALDEARVNLCPQVVFACGFEGCTHVAEATGDAEAPAVFREYVAHVVKHFDETGASNNNNNNNNTANSGGSSTATTTTTTTNNTNSAEWSYSVRLRNLLRQSSIREYWLEIICGSDESQLNLLWSPQSSGVLRKKLETRHLGDVRLLAQYAFHIGSESSQLPASFGDDLTSPIRDECTLAMSGHTPLNFASAQPNNMPLGSNINLGIHMGEGATITAGDSNGMGGAADPVQFRISRGTNPGLAAYLASQRRIRTPGRTSGGGSSSSGVRRSSHAHSHSNPHPHAHARASIGSLGTGGVNGPPPNTLSTSPVPPSPHYFNIPSPTSPIYDPRTPTSPFSPGFMSQHQQVQQQNYHLSSHNQQQQNTMIQDNSTNSNDIEMHDSHTQHHQTMAALTTNFPSPLSNMTHPHQQQQQHMSSSSTSTPTHASSSTVTTPSAAAPNSNAPNSYMYHHAHQIAPDAGTPESCGLSSPVAATSLGGHAYFGDEHHAY